MGLAAAAGALARGFDVTLLERGAVGEALGRWGPVRFFTPLAMNLPPLLLRDVALPHDAILTGPEMRREVLEPLVATGPLRDRVKTQHRLLSVARRGMTRIDYPGHPLRAERPFVLQVETPDGDATFEADIVFDATGGFALPNAFGSGGVPARGERAHDAHVIRDHASLAARLEALAGKRVLLIGHGHSAANALLMLEPSGALVTWVVRTPNRRPCVEVPNDPLPERERVVARANALASEPPPWLHVERRAMVEAVTRRDESLHVAISGGRTADVDVIVSFTGFRPDSAHLTELPIELSNVTEGGARLYRAISNITDCLAVPTVRPSDLATGEPDFWLIGSRSYGRARTFLLQTGIGQLETVFGAMNTGR